MDHSVYLCYNAADGTSDDIDVPLRKLFADADLVRRHGLMSLNSVNWCRILVQTAHFLFAYLQLSAPRAEGDALPVLEVLVPTGGAGNITGARRQSIQTCQNQK